MGKHIIDSAFPEVKGEHSAYKGGQL